MTGHPNPFDRGHAEAAAYDAWYDTPQGAAILLAEEQCVGMLLQDAAHPWLDLGTGTGRFGGDLGADLGIDPAPAMAGIAARWLPSVILGVPDVLPLRDRSIGAALSVTVFEFLDDPQAALQELARVLEPGGRVTIGFFPRAGRWARAYIEQGQRAESVFHDARFFSTEAIEALASEASLTRIAARSTLFEAPGEMCFETIVNGVDPHAGFVAISFMKG